MGRNVARVSKKARLTWRALKPRVRRAWSIKYKTIPAQMKARLRRNHTAKVEKAEKGQSIRHIVPKVFALFSIWSSIAVYAGASIDQRSAKTNKNLCSL